MYVKRRGDDKTFLSKKEIEANAIAAVNRKVQAYKEFYGNDMFGNTAWMVCTVLSTPTSSIQKRTIEAKLDQIEDSLKNSFAKHRNYFAETDLAWRLVGWFNGNLYLFELAVLET